MLATVTNRSRGLRGLASVDRGTVPLEAGHSALLDLAEHPLHRAWTAAGEIVVAPLPDKDAKAARRRLEAEAEARTRAETGALAALPEASPADRPLPF